MPFFRLQLNHNIRPDSMLILQAARQVVEEEGFDETLDEVRERVDEIESLHRTRELTVSLRAFLSFSIFHGLFFGLRFISSRMLAAVTAYVSSLIKAVHNSLTNEKFCNVDYFLL